MEEMLILDRKNDITKISYPLINWENVKRGTLVPLRCDALVKIV